MYLTQVKRGLMVINERLSMDRLMDGLRWRGETADLDPGDRMEVSEDEDDECKVKWVVVIVVWESVRPGQGGQGKKGGI